MRDTRSVVEGDVDTDLVVLSLEGSGEIEELMATRYGEFDAQVSPDGRWIAYSSDPSGRAEVYVRPFRGETPAWRVSTLGGRSWRWSRDGRELYFMGADGWFNAVDVSVGDGLTTSEPRRLFYANTDLDQSDYGYDVAPDGTFVVNQRVEAGEPLTVVIGSWRLLGSS